ncbi:MAG: DinB family protein [Dehalococcoidia bacterium]
MDPAAVRRALEQAYQENRALIAGLDDASLALPTPNPKWRVRQLAAHIAEDDGGVLFIARQLAKGKNAKAPGFVVDLLNWWTLRRYKRARAADLLPVMDTKHKELMDWTATLPEEMWSNGGEISGLGRHTVGSFLQASGEHSRVHGDDIRAALSSR